MPLCWSLVMVLRFGEGDRYLCSQEAACLLGIKGVGLLWMGWREGVLDKVSGNEKQGMSDRSGLELVIWEEWEVKVNSGIWNVLVRLYIWGKLSFYIKSLSLLG